MFIFSVMAFLYNRIIITEDFSSADGSPAIGVYMVYLQRLDHYIAWIITYILYNMIFLLKEVFL